MKIILSILAVLTSVALLSGFSGSPKYPSSEREQVCTDNARCTLLVKYVRSADAGAQLEAFSLNMMQRYGISVYYEGDQEPAMIANNETQQDMNTQHTALIYPVPYESKSHCSEQECIAKFNVGKPINAYGLDLLKRVVKEQLPTETLLSVNTQVSFIVGR